MANRLIRYQAAIVRRDRILLVRWEPRGYPPVWILPGGGREDETEEECVVREVREETHLVCQVLRLLSEESVSDAQTPYRTLKTYLVDAPDGEPSPGEEPEPGARGEITAVRWFDLHEAAATSVGAVRTPFTQRSLERVRVELGYAGRDA